MPSKDRRLWPNTGGCIVSIRILNRDALMKWAFREMPTNVQDNGWRFLSSKDDQEFLDDPNNFTVATYDDVSSIEPVVAPFFDSPIGTELQIVGREGKSRVVFSATGDDAVAPITWL